MSDKHTLSVEPRTILGRKVKQLRAQGLIPANIFGSKVKSTGIQVDAKEFLKLYDQVGDTGLIDLQITGEKQTRPVLVHLIQTHPVLGEPLHVDLRQVDLKEKITAQVPIELVGESPAIDQKGGILVQLLNEVEVEALPTDFPEKIEIDISTLSELGDSLHVSDLKLDTKKLTILNDAESTVAHIESPKEEKVETEIKPEEVEVTEAKPAKEGETAKSDDASSSKETDKKEELIEKSE